MSPLAATTLHTFEELGQHNMHVAHCVCGVQKGNCIEGWTNSRLAADAVKKQSEKRGQCGNPSFCAYAPGS